MRAAQIAAADKCLRWERVLVILNVLVLSIGYYFNIIKNVMWKKGEKKIIIKNEDRSRNSKNGEKQHPSLFSVYILLIQVNI